MARTCRRCRRKIWLLLASYLAVGLAVLPLDPHGVAAQLAPLGLAGVFAAGVLYTYGFTSGLATVAVPVLGLLYPAPVVALLGGLGAAVADTSILVLLRERLRREVAEVANSRVFRWLGRMPVIGHPWARSVLGFLVLTSPLPDEVGVALIARNRALSVGLFWAVSFAANAFGMYWLARLGRAVL